MARNSKKQPAPTAINPALRQWTRGVSFTLAMGKTQVAVLVSAHLSQGRKYPPVGHSHKLVRQFITAMEGLEARGLITPHIWIANRSENRRTRDALMSDTFGKQWQVSEAGEHVIALLKMSGIYDEVRAELEAADATERRPRIA